MIVSDDSEGSSLDSSDNDFEEQIRKMKVLYQQICNQKWGLEFSIGGFLTTCVQMNLDVLYSGVYPISPGISV